MIHCNIILTVKEDKNIDTVRQLLVEQGTLSREEPGCCGFDVYHSQSERQIFILVEKWETQEHLDAHREAKACTEIYKPKVLPLVERVPHPSDLVL